MAAKVQISPIKIIKLVNGDDVVCSLPKEQLGEKSPMLRMSKPLLVKYVPQLTPAGIKDYVALIKWSPYTKDEVITIPKDKIMTITNANGSMTSSYFHIIKTYSTEDEVIKDNHFERKRLSDKQNKEINEIFDEDFDGEEPYFGSKKTYH